MKKRLLIGVLCLCAVLFLGGCSGSPSSSTEPAKPDLTKMTAEEIVSQFKSDGLPIGMVVVFTAENDPNNLLGRPNQYTSKVNFADTNIEQTTETDPVGGSIEVFEDDASAKSRKEYIDSIGESAPMFAEYSYQYKNVLLRLSLKLTPEQAAAYEKEFITLQ